MIRSLLRICCGLVLFCVSTQNQQGAKTALSFNPPLAVSALGGSALIAALSQSSVTIDRQTESNSLHSTSADKMLFALLVDTSNSGAKQAVSMRNSALELFEGLSEGGNEGYLVTFNDRVSTSKKPLQLSEARERLAGLRFGGGTALFDAIAGTCMTILSRSANPETPRRAIVMITDGEDNSSHINHSKAEEVAAREGVEIFSVQTESTGMSSAEAHRASDFLREASLHTGGQTIRTKKIEDAVPLLLKAVHQR